MWMKSKFELDISVYNSAQQNNLGSGSNMGQSLTDFIPTLGIHSSHSWEKKPWKK